MKAGSQPRPKLSEVRTIIIDNVLDPQEVLEAAEASMFGMESMGFCIACGAEHYECEPDAHHYECELCGEHQVYGAPELVLMGVAA